MELVSLVEERGQGLTSVLLAERGESDTLIEAATETLLPTGRVLRFCTEAINHNNWKEISRQFLELLTQRNVRQASFIGFKDAGSIIQNISLSSVKSVKKIVLVDPKTRTHPAPFDGVIDWIERKLPLGLPLRIGGGAFDSKPFLHRIRCPVLLVRSLDCSEEARSAVDFMSAHLPTAWVIDLKSDAALGIASAEKALERFRVALSEFQLVAAKRPRKAAA